MFAVLAPGVWNDIEFGVTARNVLRDGTLTAAWLAVFSNMWTVRTNGRRIPVGHVNSMSLPEAQRMANGILEMMGYTLA